MTNQVKTMVRSTASSFNEKRRTKSLARAYGILLVFYAIRYLEAIESLSAEIKLALI